MTKKHKIILAICLVLSLAIFGFVALEPTDPNAYALEKAPGYTEKQVRAALLEYERTGEKSEIAADILLPTSLGIKAIHLNGDKILSTVPLSSFGNCEKLYAELRAHGYDDPDMAAMPYWKYQQLRSDWQPDTETVARYIERDPGLAGQNLNGWTYGSFEKYREQRKADELRACFTAAERDALSARNILLEDAVYLLETYGDVPTLLLQSDDTLAVKLTEHYEIKTILLLGADWRLRP